MSEDEEVLKGVNEMSEICGLVMSTRSHVEEGIKHLSLTEGGERQLGKIFANLKNRWVIKIESTGLVPSESTTTPSSSGTLDLLCQKRR